MKFDNILKNEKSKQSFMFQSKSKRFITPNPSRSEILHETKLSKLQENQALSNSQANNLLMQNKEIKENIERINAYTIINKVIPFNSKSSRFRDPIHYKKYNETTPGPGEYDKGRLRTEKDIILALWDINAEKARREYKNTSFESRLKHSAIDEYIKEKSYIAGPGAYNINKSSIKKKTFNYELSQYINKNL